MQSSQPLVSIVIPCYNHEQFVQDSIQSIIDQDYKNIELIIIDDGSEDSSVLQIKKMIIACRQRFVRFEFRVRPNKGLSATLNEALEWANGEYFSPLASDDIALPHKTRFLVDKIYNSKYVAVFGNVKQIGNTVGVEEKLEQNEHTFKDLFMQKMLPAAPAALMKTQEIINIGGYLEGIKLEDWYMWLKLTEKSKRIISFNEVVCLYRMHDTNTINDINHMHLAREQVIQIYSKSTMYREAFRRNLIVKARHTATDSILEPIVLLLKAKYINKDSTFILLKVLTPKILIKTNRKMRKRYKIIFDK